MIEERGERRAEDDESRRDDYKFGQKEGGNSLEGKEARERERPKYSEREDNKQRNELK